MFYPVGGGTPHVRSRPGSSVSRDDQHHQRPLTVMEIAGHLIRPLTPATPMPGNYPQFSVG